MPFTLACFRQRFPDDKTCLAHLMHLRYGHLKSYPHCEKPAKFHRVSTRRSFVCQWCGFQLYPTKGTVFEKTTTPLSEWFYVIYLMTVTRSGVSAKEVQRQIGVTYKTAWRMCHQIRALMGGKQRKLSGHVEVDEAYFGGVQTMEASKANKKAIVVGMVERGGEIRAKQIPHAKIDTLIPAVVENVERGTTISTDELRAYQNLPMIYQHGTVNHQEGHVSGIHHTQAVDGFWSILKRSIAGTHVWVSKKHLQKYVDEFAFRYNNRKEPTEMFDRILENVRPS